MVNLKNLPCELGNPGEPPIPVDPIDGGSIDEPEDDGEDITQPPIHPIPTVWACIPESPGAAPTMRVCKEYPIISVPANVISVHNSKDDCEKDCIPVYVCRRNRITGRFECSRVKKRDVLPNEQSFTTLADCRVFCDEEVPPGGGGGGGTSVPGAPLPGGPSPGIPTGPGTSTCPDRTYYFCRRLPLPPQSLPAPCDGQNGRPNRPGCTCRMVENYEVTSILVPGVLINGSCDYIYTPPAGNVTLLGFDAAGRVAAEFCRPKYQVVCADGVTDIDRGGPATGRTITYYYCEETIVGCRDTLGTQGWVEEPMSSTNCRCKKKTCASEVITYTTPYPPSPGPGRYNSCAEIPNCNTAVLIPIENSCPEAPDASDPTIYTPPNTTDPQTPNTGGGGDNGGGNTGGGGIIITPTDGTPITPVIVPDNQDGESLPEYQYDPNEIDRYVEVGYSFVDETYAVTTQQSNVTVPVASRLYNDIFKINRDIRVELLAASAQTVLSQLNAAMSELSLTNIKESLKSDIADILFNLTYPDGRPIPQDRIAKSIKKHLLEGTIGSIDTGYIRSLKERALLNEEATSRILELPTTQFGRSKADIKKDRQQQRSAATANTTQIDTTPNETRGVVRALKNARSLNPEIYKDQSKELLKLWYILPTDINRRIVISASGNEYPIYIKDTDTISITTSAGSAVTLPVDRLDYSVSVNTSSYGVTVVDSESDIDRAYTLNNIVEQATLHDVGSKWQTIFTVTSPSASNLELTYSLSGARSLYYVLKIDRSSIQEVPDPDSIFTRKTQVAYTLETNPTNIRNAVKFRVYPWKLFTINHNDPILGHFNANSTYQFEFTNFSLHQFGTNSGEQLFVRRIPELIIVLPTDKYNFNFFNGYSRLLDWNQRRIIFSQSPDPRYYRTGLDQHWIKVEDTYPNTDINDNVNLFGKKGTFTGRAGVLNSGYRDGSEPLPRREHGFRAAVQTASAIYLNYQVDSGLLWSDLFIRLTSDQYKTFKIGIPAIMIEKLRLGEKTGVRLLHNRNDNFIKESRILTQRTTATQEVPIKINKLTNERIQENA